MHTAGFGFVFAPALWLMASWDGNVMVRIVGCIVAQQTQQVRVINYSTIVWPLVYSAELISITSDIPLYGTQLV